MLGVFSSEDKNFLLSQVTSSFGDDCMVGTIDVREVITEDEESISYALISNNELTEECVAISRKLSDKNTREELSAGKLIEQTKAFDSLARLGIKLERQNVQFGETVTVCGVEPEKFVNLKNLKTAKTR